MRSNIPRRSGLARWRVGPAFAFIAPLALAMGLAAYDTPRDDPIRRAPAAHPTLDGAPNVEEARKTGWVSKSKSIALGDLDGDGDLDVVTLSGYLSAVWVLLNDGDGGLPVRANYDLGGTVLAVALGDIDADGDLDIVAHFSDHINPLQIVILPNKGDGSFLEPRRVHTGNAIPKAFALGDLDRDGHLDLVVADDIMIAELVNLGDGSFGPEKEYSVDVMGIGEHGLAMGDVDGDGDLDVVAALDNYRDTVSVLLNRGDGIVVPSATYAAEDPFKVEFGDLDGDGDLDLVLGNQMSSHISVLLNAGGGRFGPATSYQVGEVPISVTLGDVDGDGDLDVISANVYTDDVSVLLNRGDGSLEPSATFPAGDEPSEVELGDLDGDGDLDLVVKAMTEEGYDALLVLRGEGGGRFAMRAQYELVPTTRGS